MSLLRPVFSLSTSVLFLQGCGAPEYRTERTHCEAEWLLKIPPDYRHEPITKYRSVKRPSGKTTCETKGNKTKCKPVMQTVSLPYVEMERVDIRKSQRDPQIASCAARACTAQYGNSKCEP